MYELMQHMAGLHVRGTTTAAGHHLFSVIDFIQYARDKASTNEAAKKKWYALIADKSPYKTELKGLVVMIKLRVPGTNMPYETPAMTLRGLERILMLLGSKVAEEFRHIVEGIFTRFIAGDTSLIEEIRANAASDGPIHQAYRQALAQEPVLNEPSPSILIDLSNDEEVPLDVVRKRKLQPDEDLQFVNTKLALRQKEIELGQKDIEMKDIKIELGQKDIELKDIENELQHKKKNAVKWGKLALQEKQANIRERIVHIQEKEKQLQRDAEAKQRAPPPVRIAKQPPPQAKQRGPPPAGGCPTFGGGGKGVDPPQAKQRAPPPSGGPPTFGGGKGVPPPAAGPTRSERMVAEAREQAGLRPPPAKEKEKAVAAPPKAKPKGTATKKPPRAKPKSAPAGGGPTQSLLRPKDQGPPAKGAPGRQIPTILQFVMPYLTYAPRTVRSEE